MQNTKNERKKINNLKSRSKVSEKLYYFDRMKEETWSNWVKIQNEKTFSYENEKWNKEFKRRIPEKESFTL